VVLELDGLTAHLWRYQTRGVNAVVTQRSDALQHRRLGTLVPHLADGEDAEMLVGDDVAQHRRLAAH